MPVVQGLRGASAHLDALTDLRPHRVENRFHLAAAQVVALNETKGISWVSNSGFKLRFQISIFFVRCGRSRHSSTVISQISDGGRPQTKSRSSVTTMRIPCASEMRREAFVGNCFGRAQHWKLQNVEPIVGDGIAGLAHQTLPVPRQSEPKSAIMIFRSHQTDAANHA